MTGWPLTVVERLDTLNTSAPALQNKMFQWSDDDEETLMRLEMEANRVEVGADHLRFERAEEVNS